MSNRCYKGGQKHNFKARYNEEPTGISIHHAKGFSPDGLRNLLIRDVYVKDVCVWCGKEINKEKISGTI